MKVLALFFLIALFHQRVFADIKVELSFSPIANLVYQLDCISGAIHTCSADVYQELWERNFIRGEEDREKIKAWRQLVNRYRSGIELEQANQGMVTGRFEGVHLATKIRIASFQSMSMDEYFSRHRLTSGFTFDKEPLW